MNIRLVVPGVSAWTRSSGPLSLLLAAIVAGAAFALGACAKEKGTGPAVTEFILQVSKDNGLDTSYHNFNYGYNGVLGVGNYPARNGFALLQFDLDSVNTAGLVSAKLLLRSFGGSAGWNGATVNLTAHIFRIGSAWVEGTGNFFWFDGSFANSGRTILSLHGMPAYVESGSSNPNVRDGLSNWDRDIVKSGNLVAAGTSGLTVSFSGPSIALANTPIPAKEDLVEISIDVTEYVRAAAGGIDHGFVLLMEGTSEARQLNFATKELGDGTLGPRLRLTY